jgi:TRAP-type C4-dicarboxylate transport system substrate-binding protein
MKKIIVSLLVILVVGALILGSCGEPASEPAPSPVPSPSPEPAPSPAPSPQPAEDEPVTLKYSAPGPPALFQSVLMQRFLDDIEAASNGLITIETFYGGSLLAAGATYDGIMDGVADIGYDQASYNVGRYPIIETLEQPWGYPNIIVATDIAWDILDKYQPKEIDDAYMISIFSNGHPVLVTTTPVRTLEDLAPLKIRGTGTMARMIQGLGAAAVSTQIFEVYDGLRKGTFDGCMVGPECIPNFKFEEVADYATDISFIAPNMTGMLFMSKDNFNSLPQYVQEIISDMRAKYRSIVPEELEAYTLESYDYAREHGMEVINVELEEQLRWKELMLKLTADYIAEKEKEGIPAQEIADFILVNIESSS